MDFSINTGEKKTFSTPDYIVFGCTLAISAEIGLFYAIKDRNKINTKTYLLGERQMSIVPVALSLLVTFLSALTLLGTPSEIYRFTTMYWYLCVAFILAISLASVVFIPFFYELRVTSVFEYIEMRFNKAVSTLASVLFVIQTALYLAFVLYAPSLALYSVTQFSLWGSVGAVGGVVTLYTALGGMKAVLWTDTFQAVIIVAGLLAVFIQGTILTDGFPRAWEIANNNSRIYFHDFSFDPRTRHSFWSVAIGGCFFWMSLYGVNQAQVQRAISCPTVKKAKLALFVSLPGLMVIVTFCCLIGIVMFAFYANCNPLEFNNLIDRADQILPLYVMDILGHIPGLPGLFISCLFSGSLSSLSSGLNALGAVILRDLIQPFCGEQMTDRVATLLTKLIVLVFGGVGIVLAFLVSRLGVILQASYSVYSIINGPVFGLFVFGMFFPCADAWGAFIGVIVSLTFMCWVGFGAFVNTGRPVPSPTFVHGCNWSVSPSVSTTPGPTVAPAISSDPFLEMYKISYLYYTPIAMTVMVVVGLIVSFISGKYRKNPKPVDPRLLCPLFDRLFPCMPEKILRFLRCGVDYNQKSEIGQFLDDPYFILRENGTTNGLKGTDEKADIEQNQNCIQEELPNYQKVVEHRIETEEQNMLQRSPTPDVSVHEDKTQNDEDEQVKDVKGRESPVSYDLEKEEVNQETQSIVKEDHNERSVHEDDSDHDREPDGEIESEDDDVSKPVSEQEYVLQPEVGVPEVQIVIQKADSLSGEDEVEDQQGEESPILGLSQKNDLEGIENVTFEPNDTAFEPETITTHL